MSTMRIILLAFAASLAVGSPALASCRLSIRNCAVIADEMRNEAIAEVRDEWTFGAMPPAQREQYLPNRKYDRLGLRMNLYPTAVRTEWARLNGCVYEANAAALRKVPYNPSAKCRD